MRAHRRIRKRKETGAPPGSLVADPSSPKPVVRVIAFGPNEFVEKETTDLGELRKQLERWPVTWVNVDGLGDIDAIRQLGETFKLHWLALEDVLNLGQRPKVEEYDDCLFVVARMLEEGDRVQTEQLSIFLGEGFVLTFQEHEGDCLDPVRKRIRESRGRIRSMGADYLAYCLVDAVVDAYFPYLDNLTEYLELLENEVLTRPSAGTVSKIHAIKRNLLLIRHSTSPLREAINSLIRDGDVRISDPTRLYLRDCYDHVIRISESVDSLRELAGGLLDVYLSSVSNRMNEVMKVLTIMATMFIPLSFLAGVYGMNFDPDVSPWNMPELRWYWGYPTFILIVIVVAAIELGFFWWKGWFSSSIRLGDRAKDDDEDDSTTQ